MTNKMTFTVNNDSQDCGTSLQTHVTANYAQLVQLFGEPISSDEYKVSGEWIFEAEDGSVATLYDWKSTNLYDGMGPSVDDFRELPSAQFNIGAHNSGTGLALKEYILAQILAVG